MPITQRLKKLVKSLHQKQFRDQNSLYVVEGEKLAKELLKSENLPELLIIRESPTSDVQDIVTYYGDKGIAVYSAPKHMFDQLSDTKTPQSILSIVTIPQVPELDDSSFIALDGIADPGNVGTIIRTADWFGINQVILGRDCADIYNPKTVRSTMGSIFRVKVRYEPLLSEFIRDNFKGHKIYAAELSSSNTLESIKVPKKFGIIFGSESHGVSNEVKSIVNSDFIISGTGSAESLNVAVSAGITLHYFSKKLK